MAAPWSLMSDHLATKAPMAAPWSLILKIFMTVTISNEDLKNFKTNLLIFQEIINITLLIGGPLPKDITQYNQNIYYEKQKEGQRLLAAAQALAPRLTEGGQLTASEFYLFQRFKELKIVLNQNKLLRKYPLQLISNDRGLDITDFIVIFIDFMMQIEIIIQN